MPSPLTLNATELDNLAGALRELSTVATQFEIYVSAITLENGTELNLAWDEDDSAYRLNDTAGK